MGSQRPMTRQKSFLTVSTAAFVFIAANIIIIFLSAVLLEMHQHCFDSRARHKTVVFTCCLIFKDCNELLCTLNKMVFR